MTATRRIDEIVVGDRFRRDLGDISGLVESIRSSGRPAEVLPDRE